MTELKEKKDGEKPSPAANYLLISAGSVFTSMVIAGFIVGYVIDYLLDTTPIFFLGCGVLGFIGGAQKVHLLTKRLDQQAELNKKDWSDAGEK